MTQITERQSISAKEVDDELLDSIFDAKKKEKETFDSKDRNFR